MSPKLFLCLLVLLLCVDTQRQENDTDRHLTSSDSLSPVVLQDTYAPPYQTTSNLLQPVSKEIQDDYEASTESVNHPLEIEDDYEASIESVDPQLEIEDDYEASIESVDPQLEIQDDYEASTESVNHPLKLADYADLFVHSFVRDCFWKLMDHALFLSSLVCDHFWKLLDYALVFFSLVRDLFWPENNVHFHLYLLPLILASALCLFLVLQLMTTVPWYSKQYFYLIVIATTPTVHFSEVCYRNVWNPTASELTRTLVESLKELYSAVAVYFFWLLIELQLKTEHGDKFVDAIRTKTFKLYKTKTFKGTPNNILSMRRWTYCPLFLILFLFALRAFLEHTKKFSEFYGHLFQCALLLVSEIGIVAVHIFGEGLKSNMAWNIKVFDYFLLLMWLQGPGRVLYSAYRSFFVVVTSAWFGGQFFWVFKGFKLHTE